MEYKLNIKKRWEYTVGGHQRLPPLDKSQMSHHNIGILTMLTVSRRIDTIGYFCPLRIFSRLYVCRALFLTFLAPLHP